MPGYPSELAPDSSARFALYPKAHNTAQKPSIVWSLGPKATEYEALEPEG